ALGLAGLSFRAAASDRGLTIAYFIGQLELLIGVAEAATSDIARSAKRSVSAKRSASAKHSAAGRPSGTPENLGFDFFVQQLLVDARAVRKAHDLQIEIENGQ